jgi:hypothetical protein
MGKVSARDLARQDELAEAWRLLAAIADELTTKARVTNAAIMTASGVGESTVTSLLREARSPTTDAAPARTSPTVLKLLNGLTYLADDRCADQLNAVRKLLGVEPAARMVPGVTRYGAPDYVARPEDAGLARLLRDRQLATITGGRRTGKTVWANALVSLAQEAGKFRVARVDADGQNAAELARSIATALYQADNGTPPAGQLIEMANVEGLLRDSAQRGPLLLIVDNVTTLKPDGLTQLASCMRALRDAKQTPFREDAPLEDLAIALVTGQVIDEMGGRYLSTTAFNPTAIIQASPFGRAEIAELAKRVCLTGDRKHSAQMVAGLVFDMAAGQPELTHRLCLAAAGREAFPYSDVRAVVRQIVSSACTDSTSEIALMNSTDEGPSAWTVVLDLHHVVHPATPTWCGEIMARLARPLVAGTPDSDAERLLNQSWNIRLGLPG